MLGHGSSRLELRLHNGLRCARDWRSNGGSNLRRSAAHAVATFSNVPDRRKMAEGVGLSMHAHRSANPVLPLANVDALRACWAVERRSNLRSSQA